MYNRYQGNSGRVVRVEERRPSGQKAPPTVQPVKPPSRPPQKIPLFGTPLAKLVPDSVGELETEDVILLLILYLMYRESGDTELLIMMGAMFLL